jgi:hypothetical protein
MALQEKQDQKMAAWVTGKLPFTYIRISEDYRKYKFKYPWLAYMR